MKNTKHTPGPWVIETYHDGFFKITTPNFKIGDEVAYRGAADKALLEAAPEMLEALEAVEKHLMNHGETHAEVKLRDLCLDVIATAKGDVK